MSERLFNPTYIREWRRKRGLSLRELASRLEIEPGGDLLVSHASIGRIETGKQPYSQPILEAISVALNVPVGLLIGMNPEKEGEVIDLVRQLDDSKRQQAVEYLRFLASK